MGRATWSAVRVASACTFALFLARAHRADGSSPTRRGALSAHIGDHDAVYIDPEHVVESHTRVRRDGGRPPLQVRFTAYDTKFHLYLTHYSAHIAKDFVGEVVDADGSLRHLHIDKTVFFSGHVVGRAESRVTARINPADGGLHATISMRDGEVYRLEPPSEREHPKLDYHLSEEGLNHVVYRRSDIAENGMPAAQGTCGNHDSSPSPEATVSRSRRAVPQGDSCSVWMRLDHFFYVGRAGSNEAAASELALDMFFAANAKFRDATMVESDGVTPVTDVNGGLRFGVSLSRLTLFKSAGSAAGGESNPFSATSSSGAYLNMLETQDGRSYCLVHALTHQAFDGSVLGLAYVGTTCGGSITSSKNSGITTTLGTGGTSPTLTSTLVLTHEFGHNWNMPHDNGGTCSDSSVDRGSGGNFIMQAQAVDGSEPNNDDFSLCSRTFAGSKLLSGGATCFDEVGEGGAVCGNGIPEQGELCDCGYNIASPSDAQREACESVDPCCTPTDCQLKAPATCSPQALYGSVCCDESTCEPISAALDTIDGATYSESEKTAALCRDGTECAKPAYCLSSSFAWANGTSVGDANAFNVGKCLGIPTMDGTDLVYAKEDKTLCNGDRLTCDAGFCTGSFCKAFAHTDATGPWEPEHCELPLGSGDCVTACTFERDMGCQSSFDIANPLGVEGVVVNGTLKAPGSTCRSFTGYCDAVGVCETVSADDPFDIFGSINYSEWIWQNWWVVLAVEAGFIGLAFLLRWSKEQQDTKAYVNSQVGKMRGNMQTLVRKQLFKRGSRRDLGAPGDSKAIAKKKKRQSVDREFQQLAYLIGEAKRVRRRSAHAGGPNEAMHRLKALFPSAEPRALDTVIKNSPHEEAAVARLLTLGYKMRLIQDYKALTFAAKRAKRAATRERNDQQGTRMPRSQGYLQVSPRDGGKTSVKVPQRGFPAGAGRSSAPAPQRGRTKTSTAGVGRRTEAPPPQRGRTKTTGPVVSNKAFREPQGLGPPRPGNFV